MASAKEINLYKVNDYAPKFKGILYAGRGLAAFMSNQ